MIRALAGGGKGAKRRALRWAATVANRGAVLPACPQRLKLNGKTLPFLEVIAVQLIYRIGCSMVHADIELKH